LQFQLGLLIALTIILLAACFAGLLWRLASRFDARQCTAEWLDSFSLESYAPMERLLEKSDLVFLRAQPGYRPETERRLVAERRKIFAAYLEHLVRDFNQLVGIGKLMIVYSRTDQQEFARRLWRQRLRFYTAVCSVRLQLALHPWGGTMLQPEVDARRLVAALTAMRNQVQLLASPTQGRLDPA
jgi:hypothetical protein